MSAAASILQEGKEVILVEKYPAIGGNTVRTGGPMNAADPDWQKTFAALPGERAALEEIIAVDEATIDAEYLADFRLLKRTNHNVFTSNDSRKEFLFDSAIWHRIQTYLGGKRTDLEGKCDLRSI